MNNSFICIGRLTKNLELRYTKENKAVCEIPLAISNGKDDTTFLTLTTFGKQAENCSKYLEKGSMISAMAIVKNHNWTDKENNKHYDYTFLANSINFLSKPSKSSNEDKTSHSELKKGVTDDVFEEFGNKIEITDEDLAF